MVLFCVSDRTPSDIKQKATGADKWLKQIPGN